MSRDYMGKREVDEEFRDNTRKAKKSRVYSKYDPACKCCPSCFYIMANATRLCWNCGHEFYPKREPKK